MKPSEITATSDHQFPILIAAQARHLEREVLWTVVGMAALSIVIKVIVGG